MSQICNWGQWGLKFEAFMILNVQTSGHQKPLQKLWSVKLNIQGISRVSVAYSNAQAIQPCVTPTFLPKPCDFYHPTILHRKMILPKTNGKKLNDLVHHLG